MPSPQTMRCLGCGYDLRGLPENRCPECGRAFDPNRPTTYITRIESGRRYLALALLGILMMVAAVALAWLSNSPIGANISDWWSVIVWPLLLAGTGLELHVLLASVVALRRPSGAREYTVCWLGALTISSLTIAAFVAALLMPSF